MFKMIVIYFSAFCVHFSVQSRGCLATVLADVQDGACSCLRSVRASNRMLTAVHLTAKNNKDFSQSSTFELGMSFFLGKLQKFHHGWLLSRLCYRVLSTSI